MQDKFVLLAAEHEQASAMTAHRPQIQTMLQVRPVPSSTVARKPVMYQYSGLKRMTWERLSSTLPTTSGFICSGS